MTTPDRERQLAMATLAGRAPSPHNIQPARWRFLGDTIELWEDSARWLSVGDPSGRDNRIALGMAWEGMAIALSGEGQRLQMETKSRLGYPPPQPGPRRVAQGRTFPGASRDPLLSALDRRCSYRGCFAPANARQQGELEGWLSAHADIAFALPESAIAPLAVWYDLAAAEGLDSPAFARELHAWMRFSPRGDDWTRDGLATDCMALSGLEAWGASIALRPAVVRVLAALGLTRFLVSEADKVKTATRLIALHATDDADAFDIGRGWYRSWLALDDAGFSGVPMSALVDSPVYAKKLLEAWPLPAGRRLINLMRVGPTPITGTMRSARLPAAELLLD